MTEPRSEGPEQPPHWFSGHETPPRAEKLSPGAHAVVVFAVFAAAVVACALVLGVVTGGASDLFRVFVHPLATSGAVPAGPTSHSDPRTATSSPLPTRSTG